MADSRKAQTARAQVSADAHRAEVGGLRIVAMRVPSVPSVTTMLALGAGQYDEPPGRPGLARLTVAAMLHGTERMPSEKWSYAVDALGASLELEVDADFAVFTGRCVPDALQDFLALLGDAAMRPTLDRHALTAARMRTLDLIAQERVDLEAIADAAWRALAYPVRSPLRHRPLGSVTAVRRARSTDLVTFHRDRILRTRAHLVVVGDIDAARALMLARRAFSGWPRRRLPTSPSVRIGSARAPRYREAHVPGTTNVEMVVGWLGPSRLSGDLPAARIVSAMLAESPSHGRASAKLQERGLAYSITGEFESYLAHAVWLVRAGFSAKHVRFGLRTLLDAANEFTSTVPDEAEVHAVAERLIGEMEVARENLTSVAHGLLESEVFGQEFSPTRQAQALRTVAPSDVLRTAQRYLRQELAIVALAGSTPASRSRSELKHGRPTVGSAVRST